MAMGYEGLVTLKVNSIEDVALATSASVPQARQRLDSSSAYGGEKANPDMAIGSPHIYDWTTWDGSIDYEVHTDFLTNQIIPWIFDRQSSAEAFLQSRNSNVQQFNSCYWSSINLSASEGANLSGSVSFVAIDRDTHSRGGDFIGNKQGSSPFCASTTEVYPNSLGQDFAKNPIPYWNTQVSIDTGGGLTDYDFTSWTLDFSQDVVKAFSCEANSSVQPPKYIAVGPLTVSFSGEYFFVNTDNFGIPTSLDSLKVTMDSESITMEDLELESDTDAVQDASSLSVVSVQYTAYTLISP